MQLNILLNPVIECHVIKKSHIQKITNILMQMPKNEIILQTKHSGHTWRPNLQPSYKNIELLNMENTNIPENNLKQMALD